MVEPRPHHRGIRDRRPLSPDVFTPPADEHTGAAAGSLLGVET